MLWNLEQIRAARDIVQVMERHGEGTPQTARELEDRDLTNPDAATQMLVRELSGHLRRRTVFR